MVGGRDGEAPTIVDERIDTIKDLTLKSLRLKPDKWDRMYISDEQRHFINSFVDKDQPIVKTITYIFSRHKYFLFIPYFHHLVFGILVTLVA